MPARKPRRATLLSGRSSPRLRPGTCCGDVRRRCLRRSRLASQPSDACYYTHRLASRRRRFDRCQCSGLPSRRMHHDRHILFPHGVRAFPQGSPGPRDGSRWAPTRSDSRTQGRRWGRRDAPRSSLACSSPVASPGHKVVCDHVRRDDASSARIFHLLRNGDDLSRCGSCCPRFPHLLSAGAASYRGAAAMWAFSRHRPTSTT